MAQGKGIRIRVTEEGFNSAIVHVYEGGMEIGTLHVDKFEKVIFRFESSDYEVSFEQKQTVDVVIAELYRFMYYVESREYDHEPPTIRDEAFNIEDTLNGLKF